MTLTHKRSGRQRWMCVHGSFFFFDVARLLSLQTDPSAARSLVSTSGRENKNRRWLRGWQIVFGKLLNGGIQSVWRAWRHSTTCKTTWWRINCRTGKRMHAQFERGSMRRLTSERFQQCQTWRHLRLYCRKKYDKGARIHLLAWNVSGRGPSLTNLTMKHMMTPCSGYQRNWKDNWRQHEQITYSWCALTMRRARTGMKTTTIVRAKLHLPMRCTNIQEDGDVASLVFGQHQHKRCPAQPSRNALCVTVSSHTCSDF